MNKILISISILMIIISTIKSFQRNKIIYKLIFNQHITNNYRLFTTNNFISEEIDKPKLVNAISWYPGHIAKAERELASYLSKVDVVIEVRDARIPLATTHPKVPEWVNKKPLIIAVVRYDQISNHALNQWKEYYAMNPAHTERPDAKVFFIDNKTGQGIISLKKEALKAGIIVNQKRNKRGIQPRAVRAAVIGFPNVGKSALINQLLGRRIAKSRDMPGVTRQLMWVRLGGLEGSQENVIELLDSPGIIPARQLDQLNAIKLAICNDIGEASYDRVVIASHMCDYINDLHKNHKKYVDMNIISKRYDLDDFANMKGEEILYQLAESKCSGNLLSAADKLLSDFRKNFIKYASLEAPPIVIKNAVKNNPIVENFKIENKSFELKLNQNIPNNKVDVNDEDIINLDIGKGNYDGW